MLSPVTATASHPDVVPLGWDKFRALCGSVSWLIHALGGMRPVDLGSARDACMWIATVSGIRSAADIEGEVTACVDQGFAGSRCEGEVSAVLPRDLAFQMREIRIVCNYVIRLL